MRSSKLIAAVTIFAAVATPVLASAPASQGNPASALSLSHARDVRVASQAKQHNNILGIPLIAVLAAAAAAAAIAVAATSGSSSSS